MVMVSFPYENGPVYQHIVLQGQTNNTDYNADVLRKLRTHVSRKGSVGIVDKIDTAP